jgi:hypothetical protein
LTNGANRYECESDPTKLLGGPEGPEPALGSCCISQTSRSRRIILRKRRTSRTYPTLSTSSSSRRMASRLNGNIQTWRPGKSGVYPVKKDKVIWHVAGNEDQSVKRFQIPLVPGLTSTIHVAQGREMLPIIKLDETMTPAHIFVAMTRSRRSNKCLIEPSDKFDFSVFGKGMPLNPKNELLLAHLRGDEDFEEQLVEYHSRTNARSPRPIPSRFRRRAHWPHAGRPERRPQAQA